MSLSKLALAGLVAVAALLPLNVAEAAGADGSAGTMWTGSHRGAYMRKPMHHRMMMKHRRHR